MSPGFVHLRVQSYFSLLTGLASPEALVARVAALGQPALALTDHNNMFGAIRFYRAAREAGIKPILGLRLAVAFAQGGVGSTHRGVTLLAESRTGYGNLLRLATAVRTERHRGPNFVLGGLFEAEASTGQSTGQNTDRGTAQGSAYDATGVVSEPLLCECAAGLIVITDGCGSLASGDPGCERHREASADDARRLVDTLITHFGTANVYVELQNQGLPGQGQWNAVLAALAREAGVGITATNDVRYVLRHDARAHAALLALGAGTTLADARRPTMGSAEFYLASQDELRDRFRTSDERVEPALIHEALANTVRIAQRCDVRLETDRLRLPLYREPTGSKLVAETDLAATLLAARAQAGARNKFEPLTPGAARSEENDLPRADVQSRLEHELDIICNRGLASYFLIVADIVDEAKRRGISVGPGRGSAASSLVAYCLGITEVDPLAHDLVFERFLNPERIHMPDIDIDVSDTRRDELLAYIRQRFGEANVARIVTFGTLAARAAVRDAGRILGAGATDRIARLIPSEPGITLDRASAGSPELQRLLASDRTAARAFALARAIESVPRHVSVHAAGVVIGDGPLAADMPLLRTAEGVRITQYAMDDVESLGFLKMDVLGLRTLAVIDRAWRLVEADHGSSRATEARLAARRLDDAAVYETLRQRGTDGVFQLETPMFRSLVARWQPSAFDDLVALLALGRPGPVQRVDEFIARRHGRSAARYVHDALAPILSDTYGIIVYQEQVMHIAMQVAGYSPADADLFRRRLTAPGGGGAALSAAERERFLRGAGANGFSPDEADLVLAEVAQFAGYGFAKSHSVAYALLTYETAWLRTHHPAAFLAALLGSHMGNPDRIKRYILAARTWGTRVLGPDVNVSGVEFVPVRFPSESDGEAGPPVDVRGGTPSVAYGLAGLRNVGRGAAEAIVEARAEEPFRSFAELRRRLPSGHNNRRLLAALIGAGACDCFGEPRERMLQAIGQAVASPLAQVSDIFVGSLQGIVLALADACEADLTAVRQVLAAHPGNVPVTLEVPKATGGIVAIAVGRELWVDGGPALRGQLQRLINAGKLTAVRFAP